ncbi:MAG TPA: YajQ family cyclic di-GMP-binding protein [Steroidobacteraceae bacterium]|nr:YajQ family cyclic di-GMP-binding protein [Steroidobacteraceae bacterium]
MPSFDAISELNGHEVTNAIDQASRELEQRFDFRGTGATYEREEKEPFVIVMKAQAEFQLKQMLDILRLRLAKRGIDVSCMDVKDIDKNLGGARQNVVLRHGIDQDNGRRIVKQLKESGLKVQAQIQGEKVRVTGKKKDDLQAAIALLRGTGLGVPLQFENFRD